MGKGKLIAIAGLVALAALLLAFGPAPERSGDANTLKITMLTSPDSIDPGVSWMSESWTMQVNVYNGLLTFAKETGMGGTVLKPDIAADMPEVSTDGKTLTFKVREGVNFGPPANRPVKPSDLKYTFDRLAKLPSQGIGFYQVIDGFDEVMEAGKESDASIKGIVADDDAMTITFHLTRPDATFLYSLALPFSFAVPKGTAYEDLSQKVRTPATGPYMFEEYDPTRRVLLTRNPAFEQWTEDTPTGKVDRIEVEINVSDENAATRIMQGKSDAALTAIPRSKLPFIQTSSEWKPYLHEHEEQRVGYIWMNTKVPPFDNVKVRQAVNWGIDRRAMVKLGGGAGTPTSQILPPNTPGHTGEEVYPKQDLKKAKQLVKESGITPGKVTIWCTTGPPNPDYAQYLQDILIQLGFDARSRCIDRSAFYGVTGVKSNKTQIGFAGWGADFPEGATFIYSNLYGANINPDHSNNLAWYDGADADIERVMRMLDLEERAVEWGKLDRQIVEDGAWAPISHGIKRNLIGKRVGDYVAHPLYDFLFMKATVDGSGTNNSETHAHEVGYDAEGNPVDPDAEAEGGADE